MNWNARMIFRDKVNAILDLDDPNNYDCSDSACESICEEFGELSESEHQTVCEMVEEWFAERFEEEEEEE